MPLSDEELSKAQQFFHGRGIVLKCPICSHVGFTGLEKTELIIRELDTDGSPRVIPAVICACNHCSFLAEFAWNLVMGAQ